MNEFDLKAAGWDANPMHVQRAEAVAGTLRNRITLNRKMEAMEFGAGTGLTSFILKDHLGRITMIDSSAEMVRLAQEKIKLSDTQNIKAVCFDLEKETWSVGKFDLIINQMVLHHVADTQQIIRKFHDMIKPGGYIAIADLYPEDGSFHGDGFTGHKGFDPDELTYLLENSGFTRVSIEKCFTINKTSSDNKSKQFDVFLLTAKRNQ